MCIPSKVSRFHVYVVSLLANQACGSSEGKNYIVKDMIPGEYEYQLQLQKSLSTSPNVRAVVDTIKELEVFIYPFLSSDLLHLSQKKLPKEARRLILRRALRGLADMHQRNVLHNGKSGCSQRTWCHGTDCQ